MKNQEQNQAALRAPKLADVVHFRQNGRCFAATVVKVWGPDCLNLFVPPTGADEPVPGALNSETRVATSVTFDDRLHGRDWSWHWPE